MADQKQFNANQEQFNTEQRQFNADMKSWGSWTTKRAWRCGPVQCKDETVGMPTSVGRAPQRPTASIDRRLDTMTNDLGQDPFFIKGGYARTVTVDNAAVIALDMGFQYTRTLSRLELVRQTAPLPYPLALMAQRARGGDIPANEALCLESFRNADLIIEVVNEAEIHYIAVEASFTADHRDTDRAQRNAGFLTRFTGYPAHAAIASIRNDRAAEAQIASGAIHWHRIAQRDLDPQ